MRTLPLCFSLFLLPTFTTLSAQQQRTAKVVPAQAQKKVVKTAVRADHRLPTARRTAARPQAKKMRLSTLGSVASTGPAPTPPPAPPVTKGTFSAKFDYLYVSEHDDGSNIHDNIEVYGLGYIRMFVTLPNRTRVQVQPSNRTYIGKYGRIFAIGRDNARRMNNIDRTIETLMPTGLEFQLNAPDYGYSTLEELMENTTVSYVFEVKEEDKYRPFDDDDMLGKRQAVVTLSQGEIDRLGSSEGAAVHFFRSYVNGSRDPKGILPDFYDEGNRAHVSYSLVRID